MDDPKTRFVYTGKHSKAKITAGAQAIDGHTILINHAALFRGGAKGDGTLRTPFEIASTLFHETVHAG